MPRKTSILKLVLIVATLFMVTIFTVKADVWVWDQLWASTDGVQYDIGTNIASETTSYIYIRAGITHDDDESHSDSITYITPGGEPFATDDSPSEGERTIHAETKRVSFYIVSQLPIAGSSAGTAAFRGDWTVELYIDGVKETHTWFKLVISDLEEPPVFFDRASHFAEIIEITYPETISAGDTAIIEVTYSHNFYNEVQFHPTIQETSEGAIIVDEWITAMGKNSATIAFEITANEPGVYSLAAVMYYEYDGEVYWDAAGVSEFTIAVQSQAPPGPANDPDNEIPGFPARATTVGIFLAAWQARRMRGKID